MTDDAARASAVMEAAEFSVAERPIHSAAFGTVADLSRTSRMLNVDRLMPMGHPFPRDKDLSFVSGQDLFSGEAVLVPNDAVSLDVVNATVKNLAVSTNGLASGNTPAEAVFHGLCELIERDAVALASVANGQGLKIDPSSLCDPEVDALLDRVRWAGFEAWLFDQTTDIGVPSMKAVIGDPSLGYSRYFDIAVGFGSHPIAVRAAIRALTEAAQTRVTNVAGSRDDFAPDEYARAGKVRRRERLGEPFAGAKWTPIGCPVGTPLPRLQAYVTERLTNCEVQHVVVLELDTSPYPISVVKVFAPELEDRPCNPNWRPGKRAIASLVRAA